MTLDKHQALSLHSGDGKRWYGRGNEEDEQFGFLHSKIYFLLKYLEINMKLDNELESGIPWRVFR